jgi:hypothetical protein
MWLPGLYIDLLFDCNCFELYLYIVGFVGFGLVTTSNSLDVIEQPSLVTPLTQYLPGVLTVIFLVVPPLDQV